MTRDRFSIITDGLPNQLPDIDREETREWLESLDAAIDSDGRQRARYLMLRLLERARERQVGVPGLRSTDYINTIPPEREPWFPGDEDIERRIRAYIRWNAAIMVSRANKSRRRRRPHRHLRLGRVAVRGRLQPLLPRQGPRVRPRRPGVLPGPRRAGHLRAGVPRGPLHRAAPRRLPAGGVARAVRAVVLPAPAADAAVLGVPDRLDGPRPDQRDLPGPVQPLPARARAGRHVQLARVGLPRRRRDGRGRVPRRDRRGRPRGAGQPHLRHQLQPAAPRRSGARQRQDHPGAGDLLPRRRAGTSSRSSGDATGTRCWPATATACWSTR